MRTITPKCGDVSPWDTVQIARPVGDGGITWVSTAGHGGFFVPPYLLAAIPESHRRWAAQWSGSEQWYEEDCCWACVVLAHSELFNERERVAAQKIVDHYVAQGAIERHS